MNYRLPKIALAFAMTVFAYLSQPATTGTASEIEDIDRDALIFFVEDGYAATVFIEDLSENTLAVEGATGWLFDAASLTHDTAEARQNADAVLSRLGQELAGLKERLAAFPRDGPSFPPIFIWVPGWNETMAASLTLLEQDARALERLNIAVGSSNFEAIEDIRQEMISGRAAVQPIFDESARAFEAIMPEDHPERILSVAMGRSETYWDLVRARVTTADHRTYRAAIEALADMLLRHSSNLKRNADALADALPQHRTNLAPFMALLARNDAAGARVTDGVIASYLEDVEILRELAGLFADTALAELEALENDGSEDTHDQFAALQFRGAQLYQAMEKTVRDRARLHVEAIAR